MTRWIKNFHHLASTPARKQALEIVEAGYDAIDTEAVIKNSITLSGGHFKFDGKTFSFDKYKHLRIIGFGKGSFEAALALERVFGSKIQDGVVIDINVTKGHHFRAYKGTHPLSSVTNVDATRHIINMVKDAREDDLFIVIVSGGGSALLCWPDEERAQGEKLYNEFLKVGGTIHELNTIRKHLSLLKGGGLAKVLYPATIIGLIFCDVPGNHHHFVASGPTYRDASTVKTVERLLKKHHIKEKFNLNKTPKEPRYFKKVYNFPLVSNQVALDAMAKKVKALGYKPVILSSELYDFAEESVRKIIARAEPGTVVLAGGEPRVVVPLDKGSGGRNLYMGLQAISYMKPGDVFISFASDGLDNGPAAGAIVDDVTIKKIRQTNLNVATHILNADAYSFFKKTDDLILTGFTGANVSDLIMLMRPKAK